MLINEFSTAPVSQLLADPATLCVLPLSGTTNPIQPSLIHTGLAGFEPSELNEVWRIEGQTVERGSEDNVHWSKTPDVICAAIGFSMAEHSNIEDLVASAYTELLSHLQQFGYQQPFRFWNYLPSINVGEGDSEVYKRFCTGRLAAFDALNIADCGFPAASALGHHTQDAVVFAFAAKTPASHFSNDKQVDAYQYPRQYGLTSPSFARASAIDISDKPCLFVSGTASIRGHQTIAEGDLQGQLTTTAANIDHLINTITRENAHLSDLSLKTMKVYLRHPHHLSQTREWLGLRYPQVQFVYTHADVCRANLLVEIECYCA